MLHIIRKKVFSRARKEFKRVIKIQGKAETYLKTLFWNAGVSGRESPSLQNPMPQRDQGPRNQRDDLSASLLISNSTSAYTYIFCELTEAATNDFSPNTEVIGSLAKEPIFNIMRTLYLL